MITSYKNKYTKQMQKAYDNADIRVNEDNTEICVEFDKDCILTLQVYNPHMDHASYSHYRFYVFGTYTFRGRVNQKYYDRRFGHVYGNHVHYDTYRDDIDVQRKRIYFDDTVLTESPRLKLQALAAIVYNEHAYLFDLAYKQALAYDLKRKQDRIDELYAEIEALTEELNTLTQ